MILKGGKPMNVLIDDGMQIKVGTGIGKYSLYLYEELKKQQLSEIAVDLFQFDKGKASKKMGRWMYLTYINSTQYLKKTEKYNVIHYTNYAMPIRRNRKIKYVVTIHDLATFLHGDMFSGFYCLYSQFMIRYAIKNADIILTVSKSVKSEISDMFPKYKDKVNVAYPGLYSEFKNCNVKESYENEQLNLNMNNSTFFLFVGTIEKRKNVGMIIDAFFEVKKRYPEKNIKLVLAGRAGFGFNEFVDKVKQAGCEKNVLFTGYICTEDCKKLYSNAMAYIFPTVYEGFGSTQIECMAYNLPLILSNIPTNREISGDYGLFFELDDLNSLVGQMCRVIDKKFDQNSITKNAHIILEKFKWSNLVEDYIYSYEKCRKEKN